MPHGGSAGVYADRSLTLPSSKGKAERARYHVSNYILQTEFTYVIFAQNSLARINYTTPQP